jgi:hypothetical protein
MSIPWFPSNGSESCYLEDKLCSKCAKYETCEIIFKSINKGPPIPEWTADDCIGRGLRCSAFVKEKITPEYEPMIQVPGQTDIRDIL